MKYLPSSLLLKKITYYRNNILYVYRRSYSETGPLSTILSSEPLMLTRNIQKKYRTL